MAKKQRRKRRSKEEMAAARAVVGGPPKPSTDERTLIGAELFKLLMKLGNTEDDKDYVAYICFSVLGAGLLKRYGESKFDEIITGIKK